MKKTSLGFALKLTLIVAGFCLMVAMGSAALAVDKSFVKNTLPSKILQQGERYIVKDTGYRSALDQGCTLVGHLKKGSVVTCKKQIGEELKLEKDIMVYASDAASNAQIGATSVQASGITGRGATILLLDSGYNYLHPALSANYLGGRDFVNNDNDPMDDFGHGSHVAGLIAAKGGDSASQGTAPDAKILVGKVLDSQGRGYLSSITSAIYWGIDGADGVAGTADDPDVTAISISLGTPPPYTYANSYCDTTIPSLAEAVNYALNHGVPVIISAGNYGNSGVSMPACLSNVIAVGAVTATNQHPTFSAVGTPLDIVAPGVSLYSTWLGSGYRTASGTSQAAPLVTGLFALLAEVNPAASYTERVEAIMNTARDLGVNGKDSMYGQGIIDASAAVTYMKERMPYAEEIVTECKTLDTPRTRYILAQDITTNGVCFTVAASNIILDGAGHTISGNGASMVLLSDGYGTIEVTNLTATGHYQALVFDGIETVAVRDVEFKTNRYGLVTSPARSVMVERSIFTNNDVGAFAMYASEIVFSSCTFDSNSVAISAYSASLANQASWSDLTFNANQQDISVAA